MTLKTGDTKQFFINLNETIMLKYDSLRPAIKDEIAHLDKQIIIKKVYIVFTNYKNEWKEHKF